MACESKPMNHAQPILYYLDYASPLGLVRLQAHKDALQAIYFASAAKQLSALHVPTALPAENKAERAYFDAAVRWLDQYFVDPYQTDPLPISLNNLVGTELQKKVWAALCTIPAGQTITYTELAQRSERPQAVRAVASACGKNPFSILIPCHRVIAKSGGLGGYSGGLHHKVALLEWERAT
ncbi:MAG TPA: methylated-DNA--[protein]-cysteine S-methyltransferase [Paenalcaligenes sp.]|nr:methylated-DNA--[protein]-cysteine S-methyltransferase [Paenalcaligenes sp.]